MLTSILCITHTPPVAQWPSLHCSPSNSNMPAGAPLPPPLLAQHQSPTAQHAPFFTSTSSTTLSMLDLLKHKRCRVCCHVVLGPVESQNVHTCFSRAIPETSSASPPPPLLSKTATSVVKSRPLLFVEHTACSDHEVIFRYFKKAWTHRGTMLSELMQRAHRMQTCYQHAYNLPPKKV